MYYKKHKLPLNLILICVLALLGFKETGIFVKEYISINEDIEPIILSTEEDVKVIKEENKELLILDDDFTYEARRASLINTRRSLQSYKVINNTPLLDRPFGNVIRTLLIDEVLEIEKFEVEYGLFTLIDKTSGYVNLGDLEVVEYESLSTGISKTSEVLKSGNSYYVLVKGENVVIKDYKENNYIIINEDGVEFKVAGSSIELRESREKVTRSSISRRSTSLTKVIKGAYNELGKPYVYGDIGKKGFDCSGLTYSLYLNNLGIELPRSSASLTSAGVKVNRSELIPGDIILFNTSGKGISHAGLYIGDGKMIHASSGKRKVRIDDINSKYYNARYVTARRILN